VKPASAPDEHGDGNRNSGKREPHSTILRDPGSDVHRLAGVQIYSGLRRLETDTGQHMARSVAGSKTIARSKEAGIEGKTWSGRDYCHAAFVPLRDQCHGHIASDKAEK
jgi:hypothetical protein